MEKPEPVKIVEYDAAWPAQYQAERAAILEAIGPLVVSIEHIGSTAVAGLAAKPILDILVGVADLRLVSQTLQPLANLGYEYRGESGIPGRHYFRKGSPQTHHLHMVQVGGAFWERHLMFRDYLRSHPAAAQDYASLKKALATRHGSDREAYTEAKTDFVRGIERQAQDPEKEA